MTNAVSEDVQILLVPGGGGSGPDHWHSHWQRQFPNYRTVDQPNNTSGSQQAWVGVLNDYIQAATGSVVLAAHSLACPMVAHWAAQGAGPVVGALLVAPVDVDDESVAAPGSLYANFAPMPMEPLPFPSLVVASTNDPWVSLDRAKDFAEAWGAAFENIGPMEHVGSECKLGMWPEGQALLRRITPEGSA